jgi:hypothetical protein
VVRTAPLTIDQQASPNCAPTNLGAQLIAPSITKAIGNSGTLSPAMPRLRIEPTDITTPTNINGSNPAAKAVRVMMEPSKGKRQNNNVALRERLLKMVNSGCEFARPCSGRERTLLSVRQLHNDGGGDFPPDTNERARLSGNGGGWRSSWNSRDRVLFASRAGFGQPLNFLRSCARSRGGTSSSLMTAVGVFYSRPDQAKRGEQKGQPRLRTQRRT